MRMPHASARRTQPSTLRNPFGVHMNVGILSPRVGAAGNPGLAYGTASR